MGEEGVRCGRGGGGVGEEGGVHGDEEAGIESTIL